MKKRATLLALTLAAGCTGDPDTRPNVLPDFRPLPDQGRPDDNPESFKVRLDAYTRNTAPLLPYYADKGLLSEIDGMGAIAAVATAIDAVLDQPAA
jgi:adenylate kinase family enzyme